MTRKPTYEELERRIQALEEEARERQKAAVEEALFGSESLLAAVFESIQDGISVLNPDLTIRRVNGVMKKWYALNLPLKGEKCHRCFRGDDQPCNGCPMLRCLQSGQTEREVIPGPPDSPVEWLEVFSFPIKDHRSRQITGAVEYVRDITDHRRTEVALRENEELLRSLVDNMLDTAVIIDWDGTVLFFNQAGAALAELDSPQEALGINMAQFVHPDSMEQVAKDLERVRRGQGGFLAQYQLITASGKQKWIEALGNNIRFQGKTADLITLRDITERKAAEEALLRSEERYRQFFETDLSGAYIARPDGRLIDCNPAFARIFGFSSVAEALQTHLDCIYPVSRPRPEFLRRLRQERKLQNYESTMCRRDGTPIHTLENTVGVFDEQDNLVQVKGFIVDVTRQKKMERQLQYAHKMEAVGTLAGGIAHDFNNLLMTIQGYASLLLFDLDATHPNYEILQNIETAVERGAKLTKQLLGYARKGKYQVKPFNLNRLVEETADTIGRTKKEITIRRELAQDLFGIQADQGQMEQVLLNVCINACDAMPDGGELVFKTANVTEADMQGRLYEPKPGDYVRLTISDTGIGMDKATQERVFDPFFTTKEIGRGKGMGLASVYGIIKSHGGYIDVESEKEQGTSFFIHLPASDQKFQSGVGPAEPLMEGSGTILLADDEKMVLDIGAKLLERLGYTVLKAGNGAAALEIYQKNQGRIAMVILDMIMPGMNGGAVYDRLKAINPHVKVLLSSGYSINGQATEILQRGCDGFIQKPFSLHKLSVKLREILAEELCAKPCQSGTA
ncbi:MAG: PAS domain S-box protein [Desulfobacterales bacterium]|nr:MAG: PAS domain S-box protein [Desulfobacterales bacterium]